MSSLRRGGAVWAEVSDGTAAMEEEDTEDSVDMVDMVEVAWDGDLPGVEACLTTIITVSIITITVSTITFSHFDNFFLNFHAFSHFSFLIRLLVLSQLHSYQFLFLPCFAAPSSLKF